MPITTNIVDTVGAAITSEPLGLLIETAGDQV